MKQSSASAPRSRFDLRTVLGLKDPSLPNWDKVRAAQMRDFRRMLPLAGVTNLFNGVALMWVLWGRVPSWQLLMWLAALLGLIASALHAGHRPATSAPQGWRLIFSLRQLRALCLGALWAVPPMLFAGGGALDQQIAICLVLGGMIASAPITLSTTPFAMICFVMPMTLGLMAMMARTGSMVLTMLPLVYAFALLAGGYASNRASLRHRWAETALEEETGLVSLLLREFEDNGADWLWQIDVRKRLIHVTARLAEAFGRPVERLHNRPLMAVLAKGWATEGGHPAELRALLDLLDARHSFKDFVVPVLIAGERRWWRLSAAPRHDESGRFAGFRGVGSDVTEQRRSIERIDRMARADGLTDIDNRRAFTEKLRGALDLLLGGGLPCALMLIDLDRFKLVNDTYGHPVGDKLLRAVAGRLAGLTGPVDACGRLGGDEFALLIGDARDIERIDALARRVLRAVTQPFEIDGHVLHVGASIGTALAPRDGRTVETVMRNADLALYRVKRSGRGDHQHFVPELLDRAERRQAIEQSLRGVLDRGELRLAYQPVVGVADGELCGFEALLRWTHPDLGEIGPEEFVPIADGARLMGMIGDWVLHTACREATRWPGNIRLSINLTAGQALDGGLPMAIRAALAVSGLAPNRLELEIAEATLLDGDDALRAALDRIRTTGARLVLDDFGTGFGCIRQARFDTIKIARNFLHGAEGERPENIALVRALVTMADALGVVTIAKGAETSGHHALVRQLGCRQVQGHISGFPLAPADAWALASREAGDQRRVA